MGALPTWQDTRTAKGLRDALGSGIRLVEAEQGEVMLPCLTARGRRGFRPLTRRRVLLVPQNGLCLYCDRPAAPGTYEHVIPLAMGGANTIWNVAIACAACNGRKGGAYPTTDQAARHDALLTKLRQCVTPYHAKAA